MQLKQLWMTDCINLFHNNIVRFLGRRIWQNVRYKWLDVVAVMLHLMYLMIHFLCRKLIKIIVPEKFFQTYFLLVTAATNKLDDGIPVGHFYNLKYWYSKRYLNYKQICWQCTDNTFFSTVTWTTNKSVDSIPVMYF